MDYPIYREGKQSGLLHISSVGEDTCFELSGDEQGLYRVWVEGEQGELLLGIMENGRLRRRFSPHMTRAIGRPVCGRIECLSQPESDWRGVADGEFPGWSLPPHARCRKNGRQYELALPYEEGETFPLPPLFCFAQIYRREGKRWVVFRFDEEGRPVMTEK